MNKFFINKIKIVLSWGLGSIFIGSAGFKIIDSQPFINLVYVVFSITFPWSGFLNVFIITIEVVLGFSIFLFYRERWPFLATGFLMVFFSAVIGYALIMNVETSCGCFGSLFSEDISAIDHLIKNISIAVIAFGLTLYPIR